MKLYVVARDDLSLPQKAVQAGHALAEWLLNRSTEWTNGKLVYLAAENKMHLETIMKFLKEDGVDFESFKEPHYDNEVTAIASYGSNSIFEKLPLLQFECSSS